MYRRALCAVWLVVMVCWVNDCPGQLLHQEGFNDDGDGVRYVLEGRGQEVLSVGPGMWEHNFLVDQIGLASSAPAKRAAILWNHNTEFRDDFASEAFDLWSNLADWAMDGKQNATIGFFPGAGLSNPSFDSVLALAEMFEGQGHTILEIPTLDDLPDAANLDLLIHTSESAPDPPSAFIDYAVPGIFFNAGNHDDTAVAQIGAQVSFTSVDPLSLNVANPDHPVLQGLPNPLPWLAFPPFVAPLDGMGNAPPGGDVLLTYEHPDTGVTSNALIVIEEGGGLLGSFGPEPEGNGYIVGGDLNEAFGGGVNPRALQLNPVDISGHEDVRMTMALAATDADFEADDFLRVSVGQSGDPVESFITLTEYVGVNDSASPFNKALSDDGGVTGLSSLEFMDFTWEISSLAPSITDLVVRFEAFNTFPNEVVAIDNVRIHAGPLEPPAGVPGDYNNNGRVEQADLDLVLLNWNEPVAGLPVGWVNERPTTGIIDQAELDQVLLNWNRTTPGAAAAVPEPATWVITMLAVASLAWLRRLLA